jgi:DNA-binding SARP family transcriptional activator/tetratricopeptide (TPR) repeat protein
VLAALATTPREPVEVDELLARVWSDELPGDARNVLYTYVSRLRRVLGEADAGAGHDLLRRTGAGYVLNVDPETVDLHRARRLAAEAGTIAEDDHRKVELLDEAARLWRGAPLAGLTGRWVERIRDVIGQERLTILTEGYAVRLRLGRQAEVVGPLSDLVRDHPLDESLTDQLMLALYRSGRQADALACYHQIRTRLADQLGIDPNPALQERYRQLLTADPTLDMVHPTATNVPPIPRQLPAPPPLFVGRVAELAALDTAVDAHSAPGGTVVISAIGGAGGIGKTVLALHWAHHAIDRFPDGQLYVNLRGFDPSGAPTPPSTAVRGFLQALGVSSAAFPSDMDARVGLYRSLVADRRMLVFLDNAFDTAQVESLLPGGTTTTVLITSRNRLNGLRIRGAQLLDLDVLAPDDAHELLTSQLSAERATNEPRAVADLLSWCAGIPLAVSIIAARAAQHPNFPLAALADELRDAATRLDALDAGDLSTNLRAVLFWSYQALPADAARMFWLLGLAPGPDIGRLAAASLVALPVGQTGMMLRTLEAAHLVMEQRPGRYRMHDLTRLYAAERADEDSTEPEREAALRRLVDFYVHTAHSGMQALEPYRQPFHPDPPTAGHQPLVLSDLGSALTWFDTEHVSLMAARETAAALGWYHAAWQLAWTLTPFFRRRGLLDEDVTNWLTGLAAANHFADPATQTLANRGLGMAYTRIGRYDRALTHLHQALSMAEHAHDIAGQAQAHHAIGWVHEQKGHDRPALEHATQALHLFHTLDTPVQLARAHNAVGWCAARLGKYDRGRTHCQAALTTYRHHHHRDGEAAALDSLGYIAHHTGRHAEAVDFYRQALALFRDLGNTYETANTLDHLGLVYHALGHHDRARTVWQQALDLYRSQHRKAADHVHDRLVELTSSRVKP